MSSDCALDQPSPVAAVRLRFLERVPRAGRHECGVEHNAPDISANDQCVRRNETHPLLVLVPAMPSHCPEMELPPETWYLVWYHQGATVAAMRGKHRKTLVRVHERPTPSDIRWGDIKAMLRACGVEVVEHSGSRIGLKKGGERIVIHRPHPRPITGRATVRDIATFLGSVGVLP